MDEIADSQKVSVLKELQADLARIYKKHASAIETAWRSFDENQRAKCMKAGTPDGIVLKHSLDRSIGNVYKFLPEWNLRDIAGPDPDFFLSLLKHRATHTLFELYCEGVGSGPGDYELIDEMIRTRGLRHVDPFHKCFTLFLDDSTYGKSFQIRTKTVDEVLGPLAPAVQRNLCVPQSTGELILERQIYLTQSLNIIVEDILEEGSETRDKKKLPKKPDDAAASALAKLSIKSRPVKSTPAELVATARDQKASLDEYLDLLCTEPVVLAHAVNNEYFSRPELVADEKGRRLPVHTNKYISGAVLEAVHVAVKAAAIWGYLCRLLETLGRHKADQISRAIVLQEIANVCHLEYDRATANFKRHVQNGIGSKWFKRQSGAYDKSGNARVSLKGNPDGLTTTDPQLHHILRLCQPDTTASKAADCLKKLADFHDADPSARERLDKWETGALADLAVVVSFMQDISNAISLPPFSRKKGHLFISRSAELDAELNRLKNEVDLLEFALPIDNLLEPGMAEGALNKLDQFIVDKSGTKMGFLYEDLIQECLAGLDRQQQEAKAAAEKKITMDWTLFPEPAAEPHAKRVEERKQKEKTRPPHSSIYEITSAAQPPAPEAEPAVQPIKVTAATAKVFSTLFSPSQSRGSVSWTAFQAAMAELGFSVLPKFGSVYTFLPPEGMGVKRSLTVHRPHGSAVEGYLTLIFARRLKRVYGWGERSFVIA